MQAPLAKGLWTTFFLACSLVLAWQEAHRAEASASMSHLFLAACALWQERHPAPEASGLCGTDTFAALARWQVKQSWSPALRASLAPFAACGSWQRRHCPSFTGLWTTGFFPTTASASWQVSHILPPGVVRAKGLGLFAAAWHESQEPLATGLWTEARSSLASVDECGSWQVVQVFAPTGYSPCAFLKLPLPGSWHLAQSLVCSAVSSAF